MPKLLENIAEGMFTFKYPITEAGLRYMSTMTIIKLNGGGLWVHSPAEPKEELIEEMHSLGSVRFLVTPNNIHTNWSVQTKKFFPDAIHCASSRLMNKRSDLSIDIELNKVKWPTDIDQVFIKGIGILDETVFLHKPSGSLIVTDLCYNWDARDINWIWRGYLNLVSGWKPLSSMNVFLDNVDDEKALQSSLKQVLDWDFDQVHLCHTRPVLKGGKELFKENLYYSFYEKDAL